MSPSTPIGYRYVSIAVGFGLLVVGQSLWQLSTDPPGLEWFILAALTLLTGSFTVKVPSLPARISVSETFVFTSALLFGPSAGTITVVLDALVISFWLDPTKRSPFKVLFNATVPAIAIRVASEAFFFLSGAEPGHINKNDIGQLIAPVFAFALLYFLVNTFLVAVALVSERGGSLIEIWLKNFPAVSINYFVGSSIAMLIVAYTDSIDITVVSIIVPLLFISYLTFRTSMGRLEDAERYVSQVNELYLSTVETLAMAVDAKDQITHGHIRRVQVYAVELARRLGVKNEQQLQAVEVAALLHDMGKLAIPEHILNKPTSLTAAEYNRMKRHADIGADLLSSIKFPYPVVPIVRHHHENWDGTGYPSGISGTDIPLGARILSVVDCFDALNSDRPYRPKLSVEEAFQLIRERRGTMYDPVVVDAFIRAYASIAPKAIGAGEAARTIMTSSSLTDGDDLLASRPLEDIRENASEIALLNECRRQISDLSSIHEAFDVATHCLRQLTPANIYALYLYDTERDVLKCEKAIGDPNHILEGFTIRLGERISGWSAATRRSCLNSDASLDLAQMAKSFLPPMRSAMTMPITRGELVLGVLTAYSSHEAAFRESHRYTLESVAASLVDRLFKVGSRQPSKNILSFSGSRP